ncbi:MAG: MFS transporter [Firmicutes bacterium]|nr:MFS transporter [Bacillota bacterium]
MRRPGGLWRQADFLLFWAGQTVSLFGSQVTLLAVPLIASLRLHATPEQMGLLNAVQWLPWLLFALPAGAWLDRSRRRPAMVAADAGRALVLALIPAGALAGRLSVEWLAGVGFLAGTLTVLFEVGYQAYVPALVERPHLVEANSKLEVSRSLARVAGPSLAGALVHLWGAALAVLADAASFALSALALAGIRRPEPAPERGSEEPPLGAQVAEGLRLVAREPRLRALAATTGTGNFFGSMAEALIILYLTRELHFDAVAVGLIFSEQSAGALLGALAAAPLGRRLGLGRTLVLSAAAIGFGQLGLPLAAGPRAARVAMVVAGGLLTACAIPVYNVHALSLRQAITPDALLGRMNATLRFIVWGLMPLGSLLGGLLGRLLGLRATLLLAAAGAGASALWLVFSPLRGFREARPAPADRQGETGAGA